MTCFVGTHTLCAVQGDTFNRPLTLRVWDEGAGAYVPVVLTGATAELAIDSQADGVPTFLYGDPFVVVENGAAGQLRIDIPPVETAEWGVPEDAGLRIPPRAQASWRYQLRVTFPDDSVETLLLGDFQVALAVAL